MSLETWKIIFLGTNFVLFIASVPDLSNVNTAEIYIEPSTKLAKLTIPNSIFDSDVGKIRRILLLLEEIVSNFSGNQALSEIFFIIPELPFVSC